MLLKRSSSAVLEPWPVLDFDSEDFRSGPATDSDSTEILRVRSMLFYLHISFRNNVEQRWAFPACSNRSASVLMLGRWLNQTFDLPSLDFVTKLEVHEFFSPIENFRSEQLPVLA